MLGLLGPNGAGKTTAVRVLATLLTADQGRATVAGFDVHSQADQVRSVIGLTGQYAAVDEKLTGAENLRMVGQLLGMTKTEALARARELLARFDLADAGDRQVGTYSGRHAPTGRPGHQPGGTTHGCCSSTSPPPASTRPADSSCGTSPASSSPTAPRCCSPPSTWKRPTSSPTGSWSSTTAG